jgi:hypothetical protein
MKTINNMFAIPKPGKEQTHAPLSNNDPELPGVCNDRFSSGKMKAQPKWLLRPLIILLALFIAVYGKAQTYNFIDMPTTSTNVYGYVTPANITTASHNTFFGNTAGLDITSGSNNCFFGNNAGNFVTTASDNTLIGTGTGLNVGGNENTFVGSSIGTATMTGSDNTLLGFGANMASSALSDATAIGYNATVSNSHEMVFGSGSVTHWGFGMDATGTHIVDINTGGGTDAWMSNIGVWASSDRRLKENFEELDNNDILQKVMNLPITKWNYIRDKDHLRYVGPMAQDFFSTFQLGNDSTHINAQLTANIALVAIKALGQQNVNLASQVKGLTSQNQALQGIVTGVQTQNTQLQNSMNDLQDKYNTVLAEIENLKTLQAQCCGNMGTNTQTGSSYNTKDNSSDGQPSLSQNAPNPFSQNSVISYYLPANMPNAMITVRTLSGLVLKTFNITAPGAGQVTVTAGILTPGTYEYDMISNNQIIDSKKMVIVGQ